MERGFISTCLPSALACCLRNSSIAFYQPGLRSGPYTRKRVGTTVARRGVRQLACPPPSSFAKRRCAGRTRARTSESFIGRFTILPLQTSLGLQWPRQVAVAQKSTRFVSSMQSFRLFSVGPQASRCVGAGIGPPITQDRQHTRSQTGMSPRRPDQLDAPVEVRVLMRLDARSRE